VKTSERNFSSQARQAGSVKYLRDKAKLKLRRIKKRLEDGRPRHLRRGACGGVVICLTAAASALAAAQERPAAFVDAAAVVPGLVAEMRYAGTHNFVGRRIDGYAAARCLLTRPAAEGLAEVARDLAPRGLVIKVFDCYRPARAVANFVRWARDLSDTGGKAEFYPSVDKRTLFQDGYISSRSGHSRGSTLDLTLARMGDGELDMGTSFDFFSPLSSPAAPGVSAEAKANRALLATAMRRRSFRPYAKEWWHFTLAAEPFPNTYFDFPVQ
jgi:D-alanyl-D-alanine dipeptidase